jgi:SAM-dependent methyltransferase
VTTFRDHFSSGSPAYARSRPRYPEALFAWLAELVPATTRGLDVATGSGQAAVGLAEHFAEVVATDASAAQIAHAVVHPRIRYAVRPAADSGLPAASVDLVTVAQALHWLDLASFWPEVGRVLRPGGVVAVWCYDLLRIAPEVDRLLARFYKETVGPYWPPERRILETGYRTVSFPFVELAPPRFSMRVEWTREQLLAYIGTWSASQRYHADRGVEPTSLLAPELAAVWRGTEPRDVDFPLSLRVGKLESAP